MNTPTHALINWTAAQATKRKFPASAVLLGSIAPDLPLYGLTFGGILWFRWVKQWEWDAVGRHLFSHLFYHDPGWISLHNLLHSPVVLFTALFILRARMGTHRFLDSWSMWFFASCLLHTLVDIPVHHDDGPLILWPLNWSYRFESPLSYWDVNHFGREVMAFEAILAVTLSARLVWSWIRSRTRATDASNSEIDDG